MPKQILKFESLLHPSFLVQIGVVFDESSLAAALINALAAEGHKATQVRWSGQGFEIHFPEVEVPADFSEEEPPDGHDFDTGQVIFHPGLKEMFIAYGQMRIQKRDEAIDCFVIGNVLSDDIDDLIRLGNEIHQKGRKQVTLV